MAFAVGRNSGLPRLSSKQSKDVDSVTMGLVEKQLLALFGLKKRVAPRKHLHVPKLMHDVYKKWNGEVPDDTDPMINTVRALHHHGELNSDNCHFCVFVQLEAS